MNIRYFLIILFALAFASCEKNIDTPIGEENAISLMADVSAVGSTRAGEQDGRDVAGIVYKGTSANGMTAGVWFSTTIGQYPKGSDTPEPPFLPYHAKVTYSSAAPVTVYVNPERMENPISYPLPDNLNPDKPLDVYCVGFYPATDWDVADDAKSATHYIDGKTDVMFAEQISGSWGAPLPSQTYTHLLTWFKFEGRATDIEAIKQWGKIKKISVISPYDTMRVTFPTTEGGKSTFEYNINTTDDKEIDDENGQKVNEIIANEREFQLSVTAETFGELLCLPSAEIILRVESENKTKIVPVTLKDANGNPITDYKDTIGKIFIINLYFNKFNNIEGSCSLVPFNEQNVDLTGTTANSGN